MIRKNRKKRLQQYLQAINGKIRSYTYLKKEEEDDKDYVYEIEPIDKALLDQNKELKQEMKALSEKL